MSTPTISTPPARRLPLYLFGLVLLVLSFVASGVQFFVLGQLFTPWYQPILATLGVVLMLASAVQNGGILRMVGVVVFGLVCGFQWFALLVMMRTPEYTGPAKAGERVTVIPAFSAMRADGKTFTNADLTAPTPTIVLFYRGHW